MSEYKDRLFSIMKRGDSILLELNNIAKKMESIKKEVYPDKKSLSQEDIEKCPPLKRESARYKKKVNEFANNVVDALIKLTDDMKNEG